MAGSAGIAQLVEHDLAKVGVASSSLVSRSSFQEPRLAGVCFIRNNRFGQRTESPPAGWQSGYAADCKSAYAGSIPTSASKAERKRVRRLPGPFLLSTVAMVPKWDYCHLNADCRSFEIGRAHV